MSITIEREVFYETLAAIRSGATQSLENSLASFQDERDRALVAKIFMWAIDSYEGCLRDTFGQEFQKVNE